MQKSFVDHLIDVYKKYGYIFQGKPFSMVILFYKVNRVSNSPIEAFKYVMSNLRKIGVYGGSKANSISKILEDAEFDTEGCRSFIYTWDIFKSLKLKGRILGNCTVDYSKIIDGSLESLKLEGDSEFARTNNSLIESMIRYVERLKAFVLESNIKDCKIIAEYLERMKTERAECLREALQRVLIINQIQWQTGHILVGLGRLDYVLDRFAQEDVENEDELLTEFFTLLHKYYVIKSNALMGDTGQIVILGGLNSDGTYFHNRFSRKIQSIISGLQLPDPKVLLRVSESMPQSMWADVAELMIDTAGSPLISNDDQVVKELTSFGYEKADAYNYITSACWEPIAGESFEQNNVLSLNMLEPFEMISKEGNLSEITSYDILISRYKSALNQYVRQTADYLFSIKWEQDPLYSTFCMNARKIGRDVAAGGGKYNNIGMLTVGMANAVNSLYNINDFVFIQQRFTYAELDHIRKVNFQGHEVVQESLQDAGKHFGHDDPDVIALINELTDYIRDILKNYTNKYGGHIKFGLSSPHYIMDSNGYPASFDGRKQGEPFAVHISAPSGVAYTELMNFAAALDYSGGRFNGNVVDFMVSPAFAKQNKEQFQTLIHTAIRKGVFQLQSNVVDSKILIAAKQTPKDFPNLVVRVWGFNAYFNELPDEYKDYLIERAIQSERTAC